MQENDQFFKKELLDYIVEAVDKAGFYNIGAIKKVDNFIIISCKDRKLLILKCFEA